MRFKYNGSNQAETCSSQKSRCWFACSRFCDSPTKRRGRKKAEPEFVPVPELQPEVIEEHIAPIETISPI